MAGIFGFDFYRDIWAFDPRDSFLKGTSSQTWRTERGGWILPVFSLPYRFISMSKPANEERGLIPSTSFRQRVFHWRRKQKRVQVTDNEADGAMIYSSVKCFYLKDVSQIHCWKRRERTRVLQQSAGRIVWDYLCKCMTVQRPWRMWCQSRQAEFTYKRWEESCIIYAGSSAYHRADLHVTGRVRTFRRLCFSPRTDRGHLILC